MIGLIFSNIFLNFKCHPEQSEGSIQYKCHPERSEGSKQY